VPRDLSAFFHHQLQRHRRHASNHHHHHPTSTGLVSRHAPSSASTQDQPPSMPTSTGTPTRARSSAMPQQPAPVHSSGMSRRARVHAAVQRQLSYQRRKSGTTSAARFSAGRCWFVHCQRRGSAIRARAAVPTFRCVPFTSTLKWTGASVSWIRAVSDDNP
jgi:hypothetical protein